VKITKIKAGKYKFDYRIGIKRSVRIIKCDAKDVKKLKKQIEHQIIAIKLGLIEEVKKNPKEQTLVPKFLKEKKKENLRPSTLDRYKYSLSLLGSKLKTKLNAFSPSTYNSYVNDLNVFYNWCKEKGYDYKFKLKKKKLDKPLPKFFNHSDLETIFKYSKGVYKDIYNVLLQTGIRISELYVCYYEDGYICVPAEFAKSRRDRFIPVSTDMEKILERIQNNKLHNRTIQKDLKKIVNRYDLGNKKSIHSFRHTFALYTLLENDITYVKWLLGHSELKTTMQYLNFDQDFVKSQIKPYQILTKNGKKSREKRQRGYSSVGRALEWHSRGHSSEDG
jgi:site-specific recombinase XerD